METQKYTANINLYREITSTKMKHSNLFVSVILHFINEQYRKTNKREKNNNKTKQKQKVKTKKNKREMKLIARPPPFLLSKKYQSIM